MSNNESSFIHFLSIIYIAFAFPFFPFSLLMAAQDGSLNMLCSSTMLDFLYTQACSHTRANDAYKEQADMHTWEKKRDDWMGQGFVIVGVYDENITETNDNHCNLVSTFHFEIPGFKLLKSIEWMVKWILFGT